MFRKLIKTRLNYSRNQFGEFLYIKLQKILFSRNCFIYIKLAVLKVLYLVTEFFIARNCVHSENNLKKIDVDFETTDGFIYQIRLNWMIICLAFQLRSFLWIWRKKSIDDRVSSMDDVRAYWLGVSDDCTLAKCFELSYFYV